MNDGQSAQDLPWALHDAKALIGRGRPEAAADALKAVLVQHPDAAEAHFELGNALADLGQYEQAVGSYRQAIALRHEYGEAHYNLGIALTRLERHAEAIECYQHTLRIRPDVAAAHNNLGYALCALNRYRPAIASYRRAIAIEPRYANAHYNLGVALTELKRYSNAIACFRQALDAAPGHDGAVSMLAQLGRQVCDWSHDDEAAEELTARVRNGRGVVNPFTFLGFSDDPKDQLSCARQFAARTIATDGATRHRIPARRNGRIRIAYVSANFGEHPVAHLMAELFELHDRNRFEVNAVSIGPDDGSALRRRLEAAFDHFVDGRGMSDRAVAQTMAKMGVDIAVDTTGYTTGCRPGILARRPAPIQVAYLGFTGTMGADFIDYVLVDRFVAPARMQDCFSERLVWLPDCYQANNRQRPLSSRTPSREEAGLPSEGFVFCSFNNTYKITPALFDVWMRLLAATPDSVLWLSHDNDVAQKNLRTEAARRGVAPGRLVFAPRLATLGDHLARQRLADLFLDTLPYNAHTTASDALWAGLPVLTCAGRSFASRVAGSLLRAIGMPELITDNLADYEALALTLAQDPARLATLRRSLAEARDTAPLFDSPRFCRHLEVAYGKMVALARAGLHPEAFAVSEVESQA